MTFDQIKTEVLARCSLSSTDADTRVGQAINRHHKRITSLLGMETTRATTIATNAVVGNRNLTVSGLVKIDRIFDVTDPVARRLIPEVSMHRERVTNAGTAAITSWAMVTAAAQAITVQFDVSPQAAIPLSVDGWATLVDLVGAQEPAFPQSFHDILTWYVMAEELLRKEKSNLAAAYEGKADKLLTDLQFHLADTHTRTLAQNSHPGQGGGLGSGGGGGAPSGEASFTQTGLITFDRDPGPPFAVTPGSAVVPNLDADKVDGRHESAFALLAGRTGGQTLNGGTATVDALSLVSSALGGAFLNLYGNGAVSPGQALLRMGVGGTIVLQLNNGTNAILIDANGLVSFPYGQLAFPGTQAPSANPNTLDDFREGTFVPTLGGSSGQSGQVYTNQYGEFVKIGRRVFFSLILITSNKGTITGALQIKGLPYAIDGTGSIQGSVAFGYYGGLAIAVSSLAGTINGSVISLWYIPAAGATATVQGDTSLIASAVTFYVSGHYLTTA